MSDLLYGVLMVIGAIAGFVLVVSAVTGDWYKPAELPKKRKIRTMPADEEMDFIGF